MKRLRSLAVFLAFFTASTLAILAVEAVACAASGAGGEGEYGGRVVVKLFTREPSGLYRMSVLRGDGLLSIERDGGSVEARLYWLANGSRELLIAFRIEGDRVYVESQRGLEPVGSGLAPLYAPRPGVLAPPCGLMLSGSYLRLTIAKWDVISRLIHQGLSGRTTVIEGPLLAVRGPSLASVRISFSGGAIYEDVPSLNAIYAGGLPVNTRFAVDPEWLPDWVRGAAGGNLIFAEVGFAADRKSLPGAYLGLPWWPVILAASTIVGVAGVVALRRREA